MTIAEIQEQAQECYTAMLERMEHDARTGKRWDVTPDPNGVDRDEDPELFGLSHVLGQYQEELQRDGAPPQIEDGGLLGLEDAGSGPVVPFDLIGPDMAAVCSGARVPCSSQGRQHTGF